MTQVVSFDEGRDRIKKSLHPGMRVLSVLLFVFLLVPQTVLAAQPAKVSLAPYFELPSIRGETVSLDSLVARGPVIVNFWATWCKPCQKEMPHLEELKKKYSARGLSVVAISVDDPKTRAKVVPLVRSRGYTFDVLLDSEKRAFTEYHISMVPYTLLVDQEKVVRYYRIGYKDGDEKELEQEILALLDGESEGLPQE